MVPTDVRRWAAVLIQITGNRDTAGQVVTQPSSSGVPLYDCILNQAVNSCFSDYHQGEGLGDTLPKLPLKRSAE